MDRNAGGGNEGGQTRGWEEAQRFKYVGHVRARRKPAIIYFHVNAYDTSRRNAELAVNISAPSERPVSLLLLQLLWAVVF